MKIVVDILPECYVDTNMVTTMLNIGGIPCESVNHCKDCNKVAMNMNGAKLIDNFALGVIDNDKMQHSYTMEFETIGKSEHLELLKHKSRHHFLIRVSPAMDGFILYVARQENIILSEYSLPSDLKNFTKLTKDITAKENEGLKRLFKRIKDNSEVVSLRNILTYLYSHKYTYDITTLRTLF